MLNTVRIFLVGFMCSGKSRIGRELADRMGMRHVDIDRLIEQRIGPITPWFLQHGEAAFRTIERQVLLELMEMKNTVVSTGGGTPLAGDNMALMLRAGHVVFLDVPVEDLVARIEEKGRDRPLFFGLEGDALRSRARELLKEREATYALAGMRVSAVDDPRRIAERIEQGVRGPMSDQER